MELSPTVRTARQQQHHSGNWNVEVVRGKVTTRCFWNACKAFSFGVLLMVIGTSMAIVGYYADQLSMGQELRGNLTVQFKNESRGFHLNNLSYAGPIIMGFGGFIVVAACVMTFEARDSAAKVVPARPKYSTAVPPEGATPAAPERVGSTRSPSASRRTSARRSAGVQTRGSRRHQGSQHDPEHNRRALTAAFVQFSRALHRQALSVDCQELHGLGSISPTGLGLGLYLNRQHSGQSATSGHSSRGSRDSMEIGASACSASVASVASGSNRGSQASMVMDLHLPNDWPVTLQVRDQSQPGASSRGATVPTGPPRRSDTARRHMLTRQRPVLEDADGKGKTPGGKHNPQRFAGDRDGQWAKWFTETTETCSALPVYLVYLSQENISHSRRPTFVSMVLQTILRVAD
ncbi:uncharacterized protein LOC117651196 [Thrips palmi]|uniref:Uncharacterized protein LOC117651196 n=1 Tax=Thrips palmi TaxID=161013 RepID=A0A6P8ZZM8_THRPL|nr:uncharacterized protein LOC117651196 [Thrips palmi]